MKSRGFTFVELLGVIIILSIIMLVTFPIIITQLKKGNTAISSATENLIYNSAKLYMKDRPDTYPLNSGSVYCIELQTLVNENLLFDNLKDESGKALDLSYFAQVTVEENEKYTIKVVKSCTRK